MNSQHAQVREWLGGLFESSEAIPPYEVNEANLAILRTLAEESEARRAQAQDRQDLLRRQREEYRSEADKLERVHASLASDRGQAPIEALTDLLSQVSLILDCDCPTPTELTCLILDLRAQTAKIPIQTNHRELKRQRIQRQSMEALKTLGQNRAKLAHLQRELASARQSAGQSEKKMDFLKEKQQEYGKTVAKYESALRHQGFSSALSHESLMSLHAHWSDLQASLAPLEAKLKSYQSLPPNVELAQVRVAEAKAQLQDLTHRLTSEISTLHI